MTISKLFREKTLQEGSSARIKSTGQEVLIKKVSHHGFAIVIFASGGEYRLLINKLEQPPGNLNRALH